MYIIVILLAYDDPVLRSGLSSMNIYYQYMDTVEQLPENLRRWPNIGLLLAHRLRRWPNSNPKLGQRLMFAGSPWRSTVTRHTLRDRCLIL